MLSIHVVADLVMKYGAWKERREWEEELGWKGYMEVKKREA